MENTSYTPGYVVIFCTGYYSTIVYSGVLPGTIVPGTVLFQEKVVCLILE